uniref:Uncharacterized protein n=1 Tax=Anguilla anguilla TaxID=7936 RepID=A0A0E9W1H8_ANGAN
MTLKGSNIGISTAMVWLMHYF